MKKEVKFKDDIKRTKQEDSKELKNDKEYLAGREHKSEKQSKNDLDKITNDQPKNLNEVQEQTENLQEENTKKMIEIKPRETYLKDKIDKMKYNNNLLSGINNGMDELLKSVKKDIFSKKVLLKDAPNSMEKYINKSFDIGSNNKGDNYNLKNKYKTIKELKIEKDNLNKKLIQLIENENLIDNKNNSEFVVEQNLKEKIKKDVNAQKKKIIQKIENINEKIKDVILNEEDINNKKQENLKNFIDNFERDKEIIEIRTKKYLKEKKERKKRMANDLNQIAEKRKKELEDKDKKEKEKKEKMINQLKREAKEIENKHSKEVGAKFLLYKPYINEKVEGTSKRYLFMQKYEQFLKNEKSLIDKENFNRKKKMKHITNEELEEFNNKMDKKREEKQLITDKKMEKLLEDWNERKKTIPEYVSPFSENAYKAITKNVQEFQDKKDRLKALNIKKQEFGKNDVKQPQINKDLEKQRLELIDNLNSKKIFLEKDTLQHRKRKGRILLKKPDPNKPSKYSWKLKILNTSDNEISIEKSLIKKPKDYRLSASVEKTPNKLPSIKIDYLKEMIKEKENKENAKLNSSNNLLTEGNYAKISAKKWEKLINNKNGNNSIVDNINSAKNKIELLQLKAIQSEKLLNAQDPNSKDPELNKKVTNLIIDSIEAKLSLLNQMK